MEQRKLTKVDIDKVRHIEGFPIAKDEDIIALSRPPYYTACPNPFIEEFIRENGTPYDEATDDYHREPFAADVSEGKNDPVYMAHSYHTKVPHRAIIRYILHYTNPGDLVFDGFCGTGMTGVAALACGAPTEDLKYSITRDMPYIKWGKRRAILSDLSPAASFIAYNYNTPVNTEIFECEVKSALSRCINEYGWMYETTHVDDSGKPITSIDGSAIVGKINYTVWSDVLVCPSCSSELVYWDAAVHVKEGIVDDPFRCPHCGATLKKTDCVKATQTYYDNLIGKTTSQVKSVPVMISYSVGKKRFQKKPDLEDYSRIEKINQLPYPGIIPLTGIIDGEKTREPKNYGIDYLHQFYSKRNYLALTSYWAQSEKVDDPRVGMYMKFLLTSVFSRSHKMNRYMPNHFRHVGPLSGTLYIPPIQAEISIFDLLEDKLESIISAKSRIDSNMVSCQSATDLSQIPSNTIDYIFTDPPFGFNINYSELNSIFESWLKVMTSNLSEAVVNKFQKKGLPEYQALMTRSFCEFYRILKPNHWITVEFHNTKNSVWNAIAEALQSAGFIVANVATISKQKGTINQLSYNGTVQQDLVISAYKPLESFIREFQQRAGDPEMAWKFVRQHLRNVPVYTDSNHDGKLNPITERMDYLLFDRMVAWHIMNGIPVPLDAHSFYEGLRQRFLERDGMFFLPDQVNEYDDMRAHMELDEEQLRFVVSDEKSAIQWLNYTLGKQHMTYQEIQPKYIQELHQSRMEKMPELLDILKENFIQDDEGAWYVPDLTNAADLAKVRRKALLKEFWDSCVPGKGKLKVFRMEAIRAGFDECWKNRDFKTIVQVGERLPEAVLQEDPALLMYYDNACSRV